MRRAVFWGAAALIVYAHVGYPLLLWLIARVRRDRRFAAADRVGDRQPALPDVSLVIPAYDEDPVIARKVANSLALDYPRERLEVIVASDGSSDRTVEQARAAGADLVLDLPRGGKIRAQDRAVDRARGEIVAFSDANSTWAPDALRRLVAPFADPRVGYVCGQVRFSGDGATNQEGAYWRYEMAVRELESRLGGVTAGNGAIYATRREAYLRVDPRMGHDLSFPFNLVKRGWRALYEPGARAEEPMVPSIEGEFRRKRRMMSHTWPIVVRGGMLSPRGYSPLYALEIGSHRVLRYLSPFLHVTALAANVALVRRGRVYGAALALQLGLLAAAAVGAALPPGRAPRPLRLAHYYVLVTASPAAGLWDWLRSGTPAGWEKAEGTR
ncbi:MAG: glycosyltransferase family 2 protein [Actinomycetota bacterium]|nr:glycosyltransferase family 2 protein [Actinomycetota bacterium]